MCVCVCVCVYVWYFLNKVKPQQLVEVLVNLLAQTEWYSPYMLGHRLHRLLNMKFKLLISQKTNTSKQVLVPVSDITLQLSTSNIVRL